MALCAGSFNRGAFSIKRDGAPLVCAKAPPPLFAAECTRAKKNRR
jgi:hypothetical protein